MQITFIVNDFPQLVKMRSREIETRTHYDTDREQKEETKLAFIALFVQQKQWSMLTWAICAEPECNEIFARWCVIISVQIWTRIVQ